MRKIGMVLLILSLLLAAYAKNAISRSESSQHAILLNIQGAIGPATQDYIHRSIQKAIQQKAPLIILQMDTPGGLSSSMRMIIQDILASPIPVVGYVSPSGAHAASAGTYILYASHLAAMAPGTNIGAATPVSIGISDTKKEQSQKKPSTHELKAINDAKAYIRSLAELRNRNVQWAEKAVTGSESLSAQDALQMKVIDVIANDIPDLLTKINGRSIIVLGKKEIVQSQSLTVQSITPDWRTRFLAVITDPSIAYILLLIGFYGLVFEFVSPGMIAPGVIGSICLLIGLYALQLLPINYVGLALIILGLAFIVAEIFVPAFGSLGIGGIISFFIGSIFLMKTDAIGFGIPLSIIVLVAIVTAIFFFVILQLALRSQRRPIVSGREKMIGATGVVIEINNQQIWARVEGELWQIQCDHPLEIGQAVKVVAINGLDLKVVAKGE